MPFVYSNHFLTADPHYGHGAMINPNTVGRPFSSVEEMNETLIANHNAVVKPTDIVHILGDFALKMSEADVATTFRRLNGRKRLIIGNHDVDKKGAMLPALARLSWDKAPVHLAEMNIGGQRIVMSHYAMMAWNARRHGSFLAFGHSHGKMPGLPGSLDVGVDAQDFRPISVEDFVLKAKATFINAAEVVQEHCDGVLHELYREEGWAERGQSYEKEAKEWKHG